MTHFISPRNEAATKAFYPLAENVPKLVSAMRTSWVGAVEATILCNENRFTLVTRYLVNHLGLTLYIDQRVGERGEPLQVHHLPVQDYQVISDAVAKLREVDLVHGVDRELWRLACDHPFPFGDRVPDKPGYFKDEAKQLGVKRQKRGAGGTTLKQEALEWITRAWVSNAEWAKKTGSTRLADFVDQLEKDGYLISAEIVGEAPGYAIYHYFEDPVQRAIWAEDYAQRKADEVARKNEARAKKQFEERQRKADERALVASQKRALKEAEKQKARDAKAAAKAAAKGSLSGSKPQYGGWKPASPAPTVPPAGRQQFFQKPTPSAPSRAALMRLQSLQGAGAPNMMPKT